MAVRGAGRRRFEIDVVKLRGEERALVAQGDPRSYGFADKDLSEDERQRVDVALLALLHLVFQLLRREVTVREGERAVFRRDRCPSHQEVGIVHFQTGVGKDDVFGFEVPVGTEHMHPAQGLADLEQQLHDFALVEGLEILLPQFLESAQRDAVDDVLGQEEVSAVGEDFVHREDVLVEEPPSPIEPEEIRLPELWS